MAGLSSTFVVVLVAYMLAVVAIGVRSYRLTRTEADFLVAGRSIGPWVGGAVLAATQISAGTFVGTLGRHYSTGVSWAWVWPGLWLGWLVSALFVAPKLRRFGAMTVPDYVGVRFGSEKARLLASILIVVPYTIYLTAQYQAAGEIFGALFGTPPLAAMGIIVVSTVFYTVSGGVRSSSYVEFLQTLVMAGALVVAVPLLVVRAGGLDVVGQILTSLDTRLTGNWYGARDILAFSLAFGLGIAAAPYQLTRFYSMRDVATVRLSIGVAFLFQALIGSSVLLLGLCMRSLFPALASEDQASAVMALEVLSPVTGALFLVALISAIMSTCNSILVVVAGSFSHDVYGRFLDRMLRIRASLPWDDGRLLSCRFCRSPSHWRNSIRFRPSLWSSPNSLRAFSSFPSFLASTGNEERRRGRFPRCWGDCLLVVCGISSILAKATGKRPDWMPSRWVWSFPPFSICLSAG